MVRSDHGLTRTTSVKSPVFPDSQRQRTPREWLQEFSTEDKKIIGTDIKTVQWGWPLGKPLIESLGEGLWEIRCTLSDRIARVFFFIQDEQIVILHGIIKKTQRTPAQDLNLARKRQSLCVPPTE